MHGQEALAQGAGAQSGRGQVALLMAGAKGGQVQPRRQAAGKALAGGEHGHVAVLPVPGLGAGAHGQQPQRGQRIAHPLQQGRQVLHMLKQGLALAQSPAASPDNKQPSFAVEQGPLRETTATEDV